VIRYQEMTCVPLVPAVIRGLINLRGQIVVAFDLRRRLGYPDRPEDQKPMNVVVRADGETVSFLVDEIGDVIEVTEDCAEQPPETLRTEMKELLHSVYKLQDQLLLVLDTERTVNTPGHAARGT
ncbi:MAG TPA: chemotaxis protein CheW, partial [Candidatus Acidoferrum sp.]|nr:chemotaxis protein CheW [Candidatus Acidoferrum sp.]